MDKNTLHHSNRSTSDFYVSFLLFSTHCEFLRLLLSHIPDKEAMFCYPAFLWHCSRWKAVAQWHKEALDMVEIFCAGKKTISCLFTYGSWLGSQSTMSYLAYVCGVCVGGRGGDCQKEGEVPIQIIWWENSFRESWYHFSNVWNCIIVKKINLLRKNM